MRTYDDFAKLAATRKRKLCNNTYLAVRDDGGYSVKLHATEVVTHYPDCVVLNSGGWQTVTTKDRMSRFTAPDVHVYSQRGVWYIRVGETDHVYADGITVYSDGRVEGAGTDPKETERLRKRVNDYAAQYADAVIAGDVPTPSNGDCWGCLMVTENGRSALGGAEHVLSHIDESYFVPSILTRVAGDLAPVTRDFIARQWGQAEKRAPMGFEKRQIQAAVRKFCFRELGLAT